jgi:protein TonB
MNRQAVVASLFLLSFFMLAVAGQAKTKSFDMGVDSASQLIDAKPIFAPEPAIPSELEEECFKSSCVARFVIDKQGKAKVSILNSSGSEQVDALTLSTLKRWTFSPATVNGEPVESTRKIQIEFEVSE